MRRAVLSYSDQTILGPHEAGTDGCASWCNGLSWFDRDTGRHAADPVVSAPVHGGHAGHIYAFDRHVIAYLCHRILMDDLATRAQVFAEDGQASQAHP